MSRVSSYREAGVDIGLEADAISALVKELTFRREGSFRVIGGVGHFAGLIDFGNQVLALTTDGVGTKMLVADRLKEWTTVGIDCVAMNVNDLYVMNVEPVAFVDYIAVDSLDKGKMAQIGVGLNEGARQANIDIVGGETATLNGLVHGLDLAGTCLGVQERSRVVTGAQIQPGDLVIGVPSSGIHSNGLTLARRVVEEYGDYDKRLSNGRTFGKELLIPTRIYSAALGVCHKARVHGMCHVTGGGLLNFLRLTNYGVKITDPLPPHEIFSWIQSMAEIPTAEMYRTFNMGMGFAYIVPPEEATCVLREVPDACVAGVITEERGVWLRNEEVLPQE